METVNGNVQLKTGHYTQVQGQLMITGAEFCEFIVHTQCDMVVERIKPDIPSMTEMLEKLSIDSFSSISVMEGISGLILSTTMSHCVCTMNSQNSAPVIINCP
jgi:hypothetical protein